MFKQRFFFILICLAIPTAVWAISLVNFSPKDTFNQVQINNADMDIIKVDFAIVKKELNTNTIDIIYTYKQIQATTTEYNLNVKTATSSYSTIEYLSCRENKSKNKCLINVKTKLIAKIKSELERAKNEMRKLKTSNQSALVNELKEITITNNEIE